MPLGTHETTKLEDIVTPNGISDWDRFVKGQKAFWKNPIKGAQGKTTNPVADAANKWNLANSNWEARQNYWQSRGKLDYDKKMELILLFLEEKEKAAIAISETVSGKDIERWQSIAAEIRKYKGIIQERHTLVRTGYKTDKKHAEEMKKKTDEAQAKAAPQLAKEKQQKEEMARLQEQANKSLEGFQTEVKELTGRIKGEDFTDDAIRRKLGIGGKNKAFWDSEAGKKSFADIKTTMLKAAGLKLQSGLVEQGTDLRVEARKALGMEKEAMEMKALKAAEKQKGFALTDKEKDLVKQFTSIQYQVSKLQRPGEVAYTGTMTNELAARGGFSSSVVTDTKEDINRQIFDIQKQSKDLLADIDDKVKKLGVIE